MTLRQMLCGWRTGHDALLSFDRARVRLVCASCGYASPGWDLSGRPPRQTYAGDWQRQLATKTALRLFRRRSA